MLTGIKISNYRGIREGRVDGFGNVNIVVGPNGSGKSSLFEAIFSGSILDDRATHHDQNREKFLSTRHNEGVSFTKDIFFGKKTDEPIELQYFWGDGTVATNQEIHFQDAIRIYTKPDSYNLPSEVEKYLKNIRFLDIVGLLDKELEASTWDDVLSFRGDRYLIKTMNEVFDLQIENFSYSKTGYSLKTLFTDKEYALNIDDLASGMRIAFRLFMATQLAKDSAVLCEEFDAYQHVDSFPNLAEALLRLADKNNTQFFMSTHRMESIRHFLSAAKKLKFDGLRVFQTKLDSTGKFEAVGLSSSEVETLLDGGVDIRRVD